MIAPRVGRCLLFASLASFVMGCGGGAMASRQLHDDIVLKGGSPGYAEVFAQLDPGGTRCYRMVYPPSGRRQPLANCGNCYSTVSELAMEIRTTMDAAVVATDPTASTSMWLVGDAKVEPLTDAEITRIRSLLAETR